MPAKKILVGLDFSMDSYTVVRFVLDNFDQSRNQFVLIYDDRKENAHLHAFQKQVKACKNIKDAFEKHYSIEEPIEAAITWQSISKELTDQCRFADLFVCGKEGFNEHFRMLFDQSVMGAENLCCPVILLPDNYEQVKNVALVYDGESHSLYALKQFCRMMPSICRENEVVLLIFSSGSYHPEQESRDKLLVGYLQQHCAHLAVHYYSGEQEGHLKKMLDIGPQTLIITGLNPGRGFDHIFSPENTIQITDIY